MFNIELFTAFLWLIECSVLFVFLLLLFFLNVKGVISYTFNNVAVISTPLFSFSFFLLVFFYYDSGNTVIFVNEPFNAFDNFYESVLNPITNDLFGFTIAYYLLNFVEFLVIGFLLLIGSVICVNLYQINRNVRTQIYFNFLNIFNFFSDFLSFNYLRRQNITKQGNTKAALKVFKKK